MWKVHGRAQPERVAAVPGKYDSRIRKMFRRTFGRQMSLEIVRLPERKIVPFPQIFSKKLLFLI